MSNNKKFYLVLREEYAVTPERGGVEIHRKDLFEVPIAHREIFLCACDMALELTEMKEVCDE